MAGLAGMGESGNGGGRRALLELAVAEYIHCGVLLLFYGIYYWFYYGNMPYLLCLLLPRVWR